MKKIILSILLFISIGIAAQEKENIEKFQIEATGGSIFTGNDKIAFTLSAAYNIDDFLRVGLEGMLSGKTVEYGAIQKYTAYFDAFTETDNNFGVSFGLGITYLHSQMESNTIGMDIRAKCYYPLFSNLFMMINMNNTIAKGYLILPQLGVGLMYRF